MTTMPDRATEASTFAVMPERRGEHRLKALKTGALSFNKGYGALECTVRNLSAKGARLNFGETSAVPPVFNIRISGQDRARPAVVRWRSLTDVGVSLA